MTHATKDRLRKAGLPVLLERGFDHYTEQVHAGLDQCLGDGVRRSGCSIIPTRQHVSIEDYQHLLASRDRRDGARRPARDPVIEAAGTLGGPPAL